MASSNRHWPSMFKSKPCNSVVDQKWRNEINPSPVACNRTLYSTGPGCEERTPEPKPRWNPRPEQIKILEAIFNSGTVNPPREEIRKIRVQLQEYGQVGDANVFYWFQNRKSRSKHKQRQIQAASAVVKPHQTASDAPALASTAPNSSSSSSGKSSPNSSNENTHYSTATATHTAGASMVDYLNSPTDSVNQRTFSLASSEYLAEQFLFPVHQNSPAAESFCFASGGGGELSDEGLGSCQNFLLSELMLMSGCPSKIRDDDGHEEMKLEEQLGYGGPSVPNPVHSFFPPSFYYPGHNQFLQGVMGESMAPTKSTVFINDVCFEVGTGPFNVREAFGDDAVLIQSSGQEVLIDECGITLYPLEHGTFYYLLRPFTPSPDDVRTIELI